MVALPVLRAGASRDQNVVCDRTRGPSIRVFDFWYQEQTGEVRYGPRIDRTCAVVPLGASCPRMRIGSRDLVDDARDALGLPEVRLELPAFERRFSVESEDERFAIAFLEQRMMEALLGLPAGVTADVNADTMLLWAPTLPAEMVLRLFDAAVAIHRRVPRSLPSLFPPSPARGPHESVCSRGVGAPSRVAVALRPISRRGTSCGTAQAPRSR